MLTLPCSAKTTNPFVVIFIDSKTEAKLGAFPYDRGVYAEAIEILKNHDPKAIVLKYFLDLPKKGKGDQKLAHSLDGVTVLIQARINDSERNANPLQEKFFMDPKTRVPDVPLKGKSGWIPLEIFQNRAASVGFVDVRADGKYNSIPIVEKYQNKFVPSLYYNILRLLYKDLKIENFNLMIKDKRIELNKYFEIPIELKEKDIKFKAFSFVDLLDGRIKGKDLEKKIIILGYDGHKFDAISTAVGLVKPHRLFMAHIKNSIAVIEGSKSR